MVLSVARHDQAKIGFLQALQKPCRGILVANGDEWDENQMQLVRHK